ncbi:hypothetical protein [Arachnia propionica]|uniref:Uncharacterized protein n=1 Tax=Arachnia propionica TaxID=1750 RepID=A0A3P1WTX8_9ACTN|nr:hypothetical protein [Arachnia propionica]RRD50082.1 hypothetical protein EII35_05860 [Arachnia propionica]
MSARLDGRRAVVAGLGRSGLAAADALVLLGAEVTVLDDDPNLTEPAAMLGTLDVDVRLGEGATAALPEGTDVLVLSTGWDRSAPLAVRAAELGVPVWSEVELAWRLQQERPLVPWLGVTGSPERVEVVRLVGAMLRAAGMRVAEAGSRGRPVVEAVLDDAPSDVLVVELSADQLQGVETLALHSAAVLDAGERADDLATVYERVTNFCVYNVEDPATERMVEEAEVTEGARAVGFTTGIPAVSMVGVVDDLIVDRAFVAQRQRSALELAKVDDAAGRVGIVCAAAALARGVGTPAQAIRSGLLGSTTD